MPEVRQSSFALLGDLTKACFQHVKPCIGMNIFYCCNVVFNIIFNQLCFIIKLKSNEMLTLQLLGVDVTEFALE